MNTRKLLVSVLMLVSVLLSACAPVATPPAPTVVPPTVAPTTAPTQEGLTTFSPKTFNLPITLSYGPEWRVAEEYSDVFTLSYIGHDAGVSFMNVKNTKYADGIAFPDDFVTWIQSPDSLFQVVDSKPVLVGGFKGIQINATAACGNTKNWIMLSGTGWRCPGVERIGFIYLDNVNGERVLIQIQGSPDGKDYEFIMEEAQKVLDTVVFSKPTTFSPKTFSLPVSLSYGSEWKMLEEYSDVFTLKNAEHDTDFAFITPKSIKIAGTVAPYAAVAFPDDFVSWIQSHGLFHITGTQAVNVSGFPATQINATFTAACGPKKDWLFLSGTGWNCRAGEAISFIYLNDVYGQPVLIMTEGSMGLGAVDDFKLGGNATQTVLDTVVFSKPTSAQELTTFSPKTFDLPIVFGYGSDWKIDAEDFSSVTLTYKDYDGEFLFINPKSAKVAGPVAPYSAVAFPDDFASWIQAHGLFQAVKTQWVLVGGFSGTQIDADATSACGSKTEWFLVGAGGWNCGSGGHYRFTYLEDVNGERLLIMTVGYVSAQDFVLMTGAAQKVLDTVVFSKP